MSKAKDVYRHYLNKNSKTRLTQEELHKFNEAVKIILNNGGQL